MKLKEIKVAHKDSKYSILIGENILRLLPKKIKILCPKAKKIGLILDKKVPKKFRSKLKKLLAKYEIFIIEYSSSEKLKSFQNAYNAVEKFLSKNFNRSDVIISVGGGVIGDFSSFVASILKRGVNFINIPTTLLAQVDSSIGGKTGVNSKYGKNLIGSFYQPKLVISDVSFLKSLPKREVVCGYAEILKHSLILKTNLFAWLNLNSNKILNERNSDFLKIAIYKSCKIKLHFVKKDTKEKNQRMILNFGHTFAHAIEAKNKFSKKINHGEAVLMGMMLASKLSLLKKITAEKNVNNLMHIYKKNNLNYKLDKFFKKKDFNKIINFMLNDKKNNDEKINLILLKNIGKTTNPGQYKLNLREMKKIFPRII